MNYESVRTPHTCPECRTSQEIVHALSAIDGGIRFSSSFRCMNCGAAFETDDRRLPDHLRPAFYAANGHWALRITNAGPRKLELLRRLREVLGVSMATIGSLALRIPGEIADGTRVEMQHLETKLRLSGAVIEVARFSSNSTA